VSDMASMTVQDFDSAMTRYRSSSFLHPYLSGLQAVKAAFLVTHTSNFSFQPAGTGQVFRPISCHHAVIDVLSLSTKNRSST
jgi:hypothetical protein